MKKFYLFFIGFSMILMSCENVQEKCSSFNLAFENAVSEDNLDKAEQIAKDAKTYRSNLSESKQKEYDQFVTSFDAIIAAKKFNHRIQEITETLMIVMIKDGKMGDASVIKDEIAAYRKTLKGKALDAFDKTVVDIGGAIVRTEAYKLGWEYCMAFDSNDKKMMKQIESEIAESRASTAPKYWGSHDNAVKLGKLTYLNELHRIAVGINGTMTEAEFSVIKNALIKD